MNNNRASRIAKERENIQKSAWQCEDIEGYRRADITICVQVRECDNHKPVVRQARPPSQGEGMAGRSMPARKRQQVGR